MPVVAEVVHVQDERGIIINFAELLELCHVARCAVRREAHDLIFAFVDLETQIRSDRCVKKTDGVGENQFLEFFNSGAARIRDTAVYRSGNPFADAICGYDRSRFVWRMQEGGCRMGQMVFRTEYLIGPASQLSNPLVL